MYTIELLRPTWKFYYPPKEGWMMVEMFTRSNPLNFEEVRSYAAVGRPGDFEFAVIVIRGGEAIAIFRKVGV